PSVHKSLNVPVYLMRLNVDQARVYKPSVSSVQLNPRQISLAYRLHLQFHRLCSTLETFRIYFQFHQVRVSKLPPFPSINKSIFRIGLKVLSCTYLLSCYITSLLQTSTNNFIFIL